MHYKGLVLLKENQDIEDVMTRFEPSNDLYSDEGPTTFVLTLSANTAINYLAEVSPYTLMYYTKAFLDDKENIDVKPDFEKLTSMQFINKYDRRILMYAANIEENKTVDIDESGIFYDEINNKFKITPNNTVEFDYYDGIETINIEKKTKRQILDILEDWNFYSIISTHSGFIEPELNCFNLHEHKTSSIEELNKAEKEAFAKYNKYILDLIDKLDIKELGLVDYHM